MGMIGMMAYDPNPPPSEGERREGWGRMPHVIPSVHHVIPAEAGIQRGL